MLNHDERHAAFAGGRTKECRERLNAARRRSDAHDRKVQVSAAFGFDGWLRQRVRLGSRKVCGGADVFVIQVVADQFEVPTGVPGYETPWLGTTTSPEKLVFRPSQVKVLGDQR